MAVFTDNDTIIYTSKNYIMHIKKKKFKYAFYDQNKNLIIDFHQLTGMRMTTSKGHELFETREVQVDYEEENILVLKAINTNKDSAKVIIYFHEHFVNIHVEPIIPGSYTIEFCTSSNAYAYGLGDYGSHANDINDIGKDNRIISRNTANIVGIRRNDMQNLGSCKRVLSNFVVFPQINFAEVLFSNVSKRVNITKAENVLGVNQVTGINGMYYFFGDMKTIYQSYKEVREKHGYIDVRPKYEMFGVGWESYGALGWNAYQDSIIESINGYLERGYKIKWAVIGSGFWKGDRKKPDQGVTTAFGIWDDENEEGRNDGLPNPRFPNVSNLKQFFKEKNIKMILGLRNHFKAPREENGYFNIKNDGTFLLEAIDKGYLMKNEDGSLYKITNHQFPRGTIYMLDSENEDAVKWYLKGCSLWEADGFKEDAMIYQLSFSDHKWNILNEKLASKGDYIIVRNTAYSTPGDIIRINDSYYGYGEDYHHDPDRLPINLLNLAASGFPNTYPDIIGGTPTEDISNTNFQNYIVRNAIFSTLCPSVSVGRRAWDMNNPFYENIIKKAVNWHTEFSPYIYSAAIMSSLTGYPYTMTPLHIAYNSDQNTYDLISQENRQYEWLIGESLLVYPLFGNDFMEVNSRDVYLPQGKWIDYETNKVYIGPITLKNHPIPIDKIPVFVGGNGILIKEENDKLYCLVYPVQSECQHIHYGRDGYTKTMINLINLSYKNKIKVMSENKEIEYQQKQNIIKFELIEGKNYYVCEEEE